MKILRALLLLVVACASCAHLGLDRPWRHKGTWFASDRAQLWLLKQQRPDGFWGADEHRIALTSLATLAFLAHGETPTSERYGKGVENALRALLRDAETAAELPEEEHALLTWCLAEACSLTRIPLLLKPVRNHAAALDYGHGTPWHVLAVRSLRFSGADPARARQALAELRATYPDQPGNLLNQATRLYLARQASDKAQCVSCGKRVRELDPANWRESPRPLQTAHMLSAVFWEAYDPDGCRWTHDFYRDVVKRQSTWRTLGSWSPCDLGVPGTVETAAMNEHDARIYATALMLLTEPPPCLLPSYRPPEAVSEYPRDPDEIEVRVQP